MNKRILAMLSVITVMAVLLSSCASSFPAKEKVSAMTSEDAAKLLIDKTEQEVHDNWGEPDSFFFGMYGDIYTCGEQCIGIYYDYDSKRVVDAVVYNRQIAAERLQSHRIDDRSRFCSPDVSPVFPGG